MPGEFDFIAWVRAQQVLTDLVALPAGDDLAVLRWPAADLLLVGADQVLDGVHFDAAVHPPRAIGRKVMNRNLSDCAAMACLPAAAVVAVALPNHVGLDYAKELYLGLRDAADPFDCPIVGGDTASWPGRLTLSVTILGRSAGIEPLTRRGAKPGDGLFVTGPLGGSILGRHMTFEPRVHLARDLARTGRVSTMIDLSDGLSRDLGHITGQSNVAAVLDAGAIPIHPDALCLGADPLAHALHDGEDHELLFTGAGDFAPPAVRVGTIVSGDGVWIVREAGGAREPLRPLGWEHAL